MNKEVRLLLKACETAFRSGDAWACSSSRVNLKKGIKRAKHSLKLRIEEQFKTNSDPRHMWQGIQAITGYKPTTTSTPSSNAFLSDELNHFYGRFERDNKEMAIKAVHQPLTLSPTHVRAALSRVNAQKAAGPDGVPGCILRACAVQLTEVWNHICDLSLAQVADPHASKPPPSWQCQNTSLQQALMTTTQLHSPPSSQSASRGWSWLTSKPTDHSLLG